MFDTVQYIEVSAYRTHHGHDWGRVYANMDVNLSKREMAAVLRGQTSFCERPCRAAHLLGAVNVRLHTLRHSTFYTLTRYYGFYILSYSLRVFLNIYIYDCRQWQAWGPGHIEPSFSTCLQEMMGSVNRQLRTKVRTLHRKKWNVWTFGTVYITFSLREMSVTPHNAPQKHPTVPLPHLSHECTSPREWVSLSYKRVWSRTVSQYCALQVWLIFEMKRQQTPHFTL